MREKDKGKSAISIGQSKNWNPHTGRRQPKPHLPSPSPMGKSRLDAISASCIPSRSSQFEPEGMMMAACVQPPWRSPRMSRPLPSFALGFLRWKKFVT
jgi:hypothetical protein